MMPGSLHARQAGWPLPYLHHFGRLATNQVATRVSDYVHYNYKYSSRGFLTTIYQIKTFFCQKNCREIDFKKIINREEAFLPGAAGRDRIGSGCMILLACTHRSAQSLTERFIIYSMFCDNRT
jgi:hypothetical protein